MGVVEQARAAFDRAEWDVAFAAWSTAEPETLTPTDHEDLATTAELLGQHTETVRALQHAFTGRQRAQDVAGAVRCAFRLAMTSAAHGEPALFAGWVSRAEGLVEELSTDGPELGWVALLRMFHALSAGQFADAATAADAAAEVARRHDDSDLIAVSTCARGRMAIYAGQVTEGLGLLDEAMVRV